MFYSNFSNHVNISDLYGQLKVVLEPFKLAHNTFLHLNEANYPNFCTFPASVDKHHCWQGGLIQHTYEVVLICKDLIDRSHEEDLNPEVILTSALLHDIGKICVYERLKDMIVTPVWTKVPHYTKSLHIYESIRLARELLSGENFNTDPKRINAIIRCIGAHHGRLDYGALWEPENREEWTVHLADMASVFSLHASEVRVNGNDR